MSRKAWEYSSGLMADGVLDVRFHSLPRAAYLSIRFSLDRNISSPFPPCSWPSP